MTAPDYSGPRGKHDEHALQLWIHAVPSKERHVVHDTLLEKVFPVLVTWIKTFDSPATALRQTDHSVSFFIRDGKVDVQRE